MLDRLLVLGRAVEPAATARDGFALDRLHFRFAYRAAGRHDEHRCGLGAEFRQASHNLRDDIAGPPHYYGIADADVLAPHLVGIMQGGVGDGDPAHENRLQPRYRSQGASTSHLHINGDDAGRRFLGRELVGDRPTWCAGDITQRRTVDQPIDLVDHAIDLVGQGLPPRQQIGVVGQAAGDAAHRVQFGIDRYAPVPKSGQ